MTEPKTKAIHEAKIKMHAEPPPALGRVLFEREIPSDVALITPLIIRVAEFLREEELVPETFKSKLQLCLDEALRNAVIHGNQKDFSKKVKVRAFETESHWGVLVEDEGKGFTLDKLADPSSEKSLWGEGGRGIHLMAHYMERVEFYSGGRVLVMGNSR